MMGFYMWRPVYDNGFYAKFCSRIEITKFQHGRRKYYNHGITLLNVAFLIFILLIIFLFCLRPHKKHVRL